jgi:hypothetical protein
VVVGVVGVKASGVVKLTTHHPCSGGGHHLEAGDRCGVETWRWGGDDRADCSDEGSGRADSRVLGGLIITIGRRGLFLTGGMRGYPRGIPSPYNCQGTEFQIPDAVRVQDP